MTSAQLDHFRLPPQTPRLPCAVVEADLLKRIDALSSTETNALRSSWDSIEALSNPTDLVAALRGAQLSRLGDALEQSLKISALDEVKRKYGQMLGYLSPQELEDSVETNLASGAKRALLSVLGVER